MKKYVSIGLLLFFGLYVFTFKTHVCYYYDAHIGIHASWDHNSNIQYCQDHKANGRYHGDCQWEIKEAAEKGKLADYNILPVQYYCIDVLTNAQIEETKNHILKHDVRNLFISPYPVDIREKSFIQEYFPLPEVNCRGGPPLQIHHLRGPPLV